MSKRKKRSDRAGQWRTAQVTETRSMVKCDGCNASVEVLNEFLRRAKVALAKMCVCP